MSRASLRRLIGAVLIVGLPAAAAAQDAPRPDPAAAARNPAATDTRRATTGTTTTPAPTQAKLPADSVTQHTVELPGRKLQVQATAGALPLSNADGQLQTEIAYIAYALAGSDAKTRPVTFVFNGGPGSASAWLHLGTIGPWRLAFDRAHAAPSASRVLLPNAETWLDFTDLVFIDPAGTGYSRIVKPNASNPGDAAATAQQGGPRANAASRPDAWSVTGDIQSLADFIQKWIGKTGRHLSPVVIAGESYGGFRTPRIAHMLQTSHGIGVNAQIIISPVLDYGTLRNNRWQPMANVTLLPSLAAAALEAQGKTPTPEIMRDVETYARGAFLADLMRGPRDAAAFDRIVGQVARLTGLAEPVVRQYGGRLDSFIYRREANRAAGRVASPYDASMTGLDVDPTAYFSRFDDPFTTGLRAPVTSAMLDLYANRLNWRVDAKYQITNSEVVSGWQYGNSTVPPESMTQLRSSLALDPRMTVLVAHGFTDLVTPYFATTLLLDQVQDYGRPGRLRQVTYPGGHMFYARDATRVTFREDVQKTIAEGVKQGE